MKPLLSIVVAVYNVENYLEQCIDSILKQKLQKIEVILVDDGSTDSSGKICDYYAKSDSRIKVIHKVNGGQSSARNIGIDGAIGEYIGFIDSDDWISEEMYDILFQHAKKEKSDIVSCNFLVMKQDGRFEPYTKDTKNIEYSKAGAMAEIWSNKILTFSCWNKIYNRKLFHDLRFREGIIFEDMDISYKLIEKSNRVSYIAKPLYFYRYNLGSTLRSEFSEKKLDEYKVKFDMYEFYKKKYPEVSDLLYLELMETGMNLYRGISKLENFGKNKKKYNYLVDFDTNILKKLFFSKYLTLKQKRRLLKKCIRLFFDLFD